MEVLVCKSCGSNNFEHIDGFYICQYCGTRHVDDRPKVASLGNVGVIEDLLKRADMYWKLGREAQAVPLYRQALDIDPKCEIAKERVEVGRA